MDSSTHYYSLQIFQQSSLMQNEESIKDDFYPSVELKYAHQGGLHTMYRPTWGKSEGSNYVLKTERKLEKDFYWSFTICKWLFSKL